MKFRLIIDENAEEEVVATVHQRSPLTDRLEALVTQDGFRDRVPGYREDDMIMLSFSEIVCVTALDGKVWAIDCHGTQYRLKLKLYEIEQRLPPCFIRINKSSIANEHHLERFVATISGAVDAVFRGGYREYVSRRCFAAIKRRYEK